jgi:protease PrsW
VLFGSLVPILILPVEIGAAHLLAGSQSLDGFATIIRAFPIAAGSEELAKYLLLIGVVLPRVDFNEGKSVYTSGLAVSLGFATMENIFYLIHAPDAVALAIGRAMTVVPMHAASGAVMGGLLARALTRPEQATRSYFFALLIPVLVHGSYDFVVRTAARSGSQHGTSVVPHEVYAVLLIGIVIIAIGAAALAAPQIARGADGTRPVL